MSFNAEKAITDWEKDNIIMGIDEAGRSQVLGPMVYACAYWKEEYDEKIRLKFKFNNSKDLNPKEREKMFAQINSHQNIIRYEIIILNADLISCDMLRREKISLNQMSHYSTIELIKMVLNKKVNICKVFVKKVGSADKYKEKIVNELNKKSIQIKVESKADVIYECVCAASIIAKVSSIHLIEKLDIQDKDYGSGNPSDPFTQKWLNKNYDNIFGYGREVRFSWKTISNKFKENNNKCEWEDYVSDEEIEKFKKKYKKREKHEINLIFDFSESKECLSEKNKNFLPEEEIKGFYKRNNINFDIFF